MIIISLWKIYTHFKSKHIVNSTFLEECPNKKGKYIMSNITTFFTTSKQYF